MKAKKVTVIYTNLTVEELQVMVKALNHHRTHQRQ